MHWSPTNLNSHSTKVTSRTLSVTLSWTTANLWSYLYPGKLTREWLKRWKGPSEVQWPALTQWWLSTLLSMYSLAHRSNSSGAWSTRFNSLSSSLSGKRHRSLLMWRWWSNLCGRLHWENSYPSIFSLTQLRNSWRWRRIRGSFQTWAPSSYLSSSFQSSVLSSSCS